MPITQERMMRLINAAGEVTATYGAMLQHVKTVRAQLVQETKEGKILDAVGEFDALIETFYRLSPSPEAVSAVAEERGHFNARRARNDRARTHIAALRRVQVEDKLIAQPIDIGEGEARFPRAIIDTTKLHTQIYSLWKTGIRIGEPTINAQLIANLVSDSGEPRETEHLRIINELIAAGVLIPTEIGGEYTVKEPGL